MLLYQLKELTVENNSFLYTEDQLMARLRFFIGVCLALTLTGIVFVVLYSIIFVTQPLNAISPIDQKFFELIIPIATFLTGTLSGIMLAGNDKESQKEALKAANKGWDKPPTPVAPPAPVSPMMGYGAMMPGMPGRMEPTLGVMPQSVMTGYGGKLAPPPAPQPEI
jgi:hypothetical protein